MSRKQISTDIGLKFWKHNADQSKKNLRIRTVVWLNLKTCKIFISKG